MTIREMEKGKEFHNFYAEFKKFIGFKGSSFQENSKQGRIPGFLRINSIYEFHEKSLIILNA